MVALFLRPDADQSDGGWLNESASGTNIYASVDESSLSDTDYMVSSTTDGDKVRLRLSDPSAGVVAPLIVRYRCKRVGTVAANLIGRLYQGTAPGTLIATWTRLAVPDSFTTYTYTLTSGEFASISDFTDLYVEFELSQQSSLKVDLNFAEGTFYDSGTVSDATGNLSCVRASIGYAKTSTGTLTSFASNVLRITDLGLLVEDARTNSLVRSQDFSTTWSEGGNPVSVSGTFTAPDGTSTAQKLTPDASAGGHYRAQVFTGAAVTYAVSVYAKDAGYGFASLTVAVNGGAGGRYGINVNLSTGAVADTNTTGSPTIVSNGTELLGNGWVRIFFIVTATAGDFYVQLGPVPTATPTWSNSLPAFTGDGSSGGYFWGAQVEVGAFPSSYIPTTSGSQTRAADAVTVIGNINTILSALPQSMMVDLIWTGTATAMSGINSHIVGISGGDAPLFIEGGTTNLRGYFGGYSIAATLGNSLTYVTGVKVAVGVNSSGNSLVGGGGTVVSNSVNSANANYHFCTTTGAGGNIFGYVRRFTIWNTRLADATLQGFTYP